MNTKLIQFSKLTFQIQTGRRDALLKYAQLIREHADELYWLEAIVSGKPKSFGDFEIDMLSRHLICKGTFIAKLH